jgi:hypothetical protein
LLKTALRKKAEFERREVIYLTGPVGVGLSLVGFTACFAIAALQLLFKDDCLTGSILGTSTWNESNATR